MPGLKLNYSKNIFNFASLYLCLLVILIIGFSVYRVSNSDNSSLKQDQITVRIIGKNVDAFNQEIWYGWYNFSIWQIQSKSRLDLGYEYKFNSKINTFDKDERFQLYNLSTGVVGKIKVEGAILKNQICDLNCNLIENTANFKSASERVFLQGSCHDFWPIIKSLTEDLDCSDSAGLSIGLVIGGTDYFSKELKNDFKKTGLMHIVAVSGFQIGLIMSLVEFLFRRSLIPRNIRLFGFIAVLSFFIFLFGPEPPVLRSSLSFLISSSTIFILGRRVNGLRALIYSGILMLLINPFYLFSISFQLSFVASFALIMSFESDIFEFKQLKNFWNLFISTLATFLYTLPIITSIGGSISLIAVFTNLLIIPLIPVITGLNILGLIPVIGSFFLMLALIVQTVLIIVIKQLAQTFPAINFDRFNFIELILYYLVLTLGFLILPKIFSALSKK